MEWIDVEERKPPNDIYVLVSIYDGREKVKLSHVDIAARYGNDWVYDDEDKKVDPKYGYVTHWMPLPDPFDMKKKEIE